MGEIRSLRWPLAAAPVGVAAAQLAPLGLALGPVARRFPDAGADDAVVALLIGSIVLSLLSELFEAVREATKGGVWLAWLAGILCGTGEIGTAAFLTLAAPALLFAIHRFGRWLRGRAGNGESGARGSG